MIQSALIGVLVSGFTLGCTHSAQSGLEVKATDAGAIQYIHHKPAATQPRRHVILAHGFLRSPVTMNHLAKSLAEHGIETASIKLHRSKPWAGNHAENARDMIALRKALGWNKVTYAGFSAGGLSALLAAAEDPACEKLILLDPVDQGNLGTTAAPKVRIPVLAILGQPGPGNANRNATPMLEALPRSKTIELANATHCDFESRPSALCYCLSGTKADLKRIAGIHASIIRHSTAFLSNHLVIQQR